MSKGYINLTLREKLYVSAAGNEVALPISSHADGAVGVIVVFSSFEEAKAYNKYAEVLEVEVSLSSQNQLKQGE